MSTVLKFVSRGTLWCSQKNSISVKLRTLCTSSTSNWTSSIEEPYVKLELSETEVTIPAVWLRHHCRCPECYSSLTNQRLLIPSDLPRNCEVRQVSTHHTPHGQATTEIIWEDQHVSTFGTKWLEAKWKLVRKFDKRLNIHGIKHIPNTSTTSDPKEVHVSYHQFMDSDDGLVQAVKNIRSFGLTLITQSPADKISTERAISRISQPMNTIYGDFYEFESNLEHADTAYTSGYVHLHTDTTYFTEPAGLQAFHCLHHTGEGGLNSLVDGFQVAREVLRRKPEYYEILSEFLIPWNYIDPGKHEFYSVSPIFHHNPYSGELDCVRYNPHDLATLVTVPEENIPVFYKSLIYLSDVVQSAPMWLKLQPGTILIFDNWRMLHGRNEFTGNRKLCGAYISRSDWLSKARVLFSKTDI